MNHYPSLTYAAFCLLPIAAPAHAQLTAPEPPALQDSIHQAGACEITNGQESCSRVVACIGVEGTWFNGRAFGRGEGVLDGQLSTGAHCTGRWVQQNPVGLGQADVSCDDGMTTTVLYTYQDAYTGTAIGHGRTNRDELVEVWSGQNVLAFFQTEDPDNPVISMHCGLTLIPLS